MKKIISLITMIALVFTSCDPLEDINVEVDVKINENAMLDGVTGNEEITLTEDDYESLNLSENYIDSKQFAKSSLPEFLTNLYPTYGRYSSVLVNYNFYRNMQVTLAPNQYPDATKSSFSPSDDIEAHINNILGEGQDNDSHLVTYLVEQDSRTVTTIYEQGFESEEALTDRVFDLAGENFKWEIGENIGSDGTKYGDEVFAVMSAYPNEVSDDWWVSPEIDLTDSESTTFQITQYINYAFGEMESQKIWVSSDYDGDEPNVQDWTEISLNTRPAGNNHDFVTSEKYDLSDFDGEKIHIAFQYIATETNGSRWRIDNFEVSGSIPTPTKKFHEFFVLEEVSTDSLAWKRDDSPFILASTDYLSMGQSSDDSTNFPGDINGFDNAIHPDQYLPLYLSKQEQYAYPLDSTSVNVLYTMNQEVAGSQYTFTGGQWVATPTITESSMKFEHDGNEWAAVEFIEYELTEDDYNMFGNEYPSIFPDIDKTLFENILTYGNIGFVWVDDIEEEWDKESNLIYPVFSYFLKNKFPDTPSNKRFRLTFSYYSYGRKTVRQDFKINSDGEIVAEKKPLVTEN